MMSYVLLEKRNPQKLTKNQNDLILIFNVNKQSNKKIIISTFMTLK